MGTTTVKALGRRVLEIIRQVGGEKGWATIEEFDDAALAAIPAEEWDVIETRARREFIREKVQEGKDENGLREIERVVTTLPDGSRESRYKQRELFDVDDYRFTVAYRAGVVRYNYAYMKALISECAEKHRAQLPLPIINGD